MKFFNLGLTGLKQGLIKHKGYDKIKILCLKQYNVLIELRLSNLKKCIGSKLFGKHEAKENGNPRISKVKGVTTDLADKTPMNTSHKLFLERRYALSV